MKILIISATRGVGRYLADQAVEMGEQVTVIVWTEVRPGFLTNGPRTGHYRVLTDMTGLKRQSGELDGFPLDCPFWYQKHHF
jgi:putative NADH-flavin reductase